MKLVLALLASLCAVLSVPAAAHDYKLGALQIAHPWSRATPKGATIGAGYLTITNTGSEPDRLVGGSAVAAKRFEIHEMAVVDGVMKMREIAGGLEIKPKAKLEFKPGSYHLMFVDLREPLVKGKSFKGTLVFEKAGTIEVEYTVEAIGASGSTHHH